MKTYSGNELIKVAKYRQSAQEFLGQLEAKGFAVETVTVEDSTATFHYKAEQDGQTVYADILVKSSKGEIGAKAKCGSRSHKYEFERTYYSSERSDFFKWIDCVTKLNTTEALDGSMSLPHDLWYSIPKNKAFCERVRNDLLPLTKCDYQLNNLANLVHMPDDQYNFGISIGAFPQLVYSAQINDFVRDPKHPELFIDIGITSRQSGFITIKCYDFDPRGNDLKRKMYPETKLVAVKNHTPDNGEYIYHTDYETALKLVKEAKDRLWAIYDEEAKRHGMPETWKEATDWTTDGPVYPEGSSAGESITKKRDDARAKLIEQNLRVIKAQVSRRCDASLEDTFPGAQYLDKVPKWREESILHGNQYYYEAYATIPYKFPNIKGSKIAWQDKVIEITITYDKSFDRFTISYRIPFKFACMCGVYDWFYEAKKHDTEKMMIIKNSGRATHTDIGSSGFRYIKQHLDELKQFAEYKGFKE